jgi:hypothetical protein
VIADAGRVSSLAHALASARLADGLAERRGQEAIKALADDVDMKQPLDHLAVGGAGSHHGEVGIHQKCALGAVFHNRHDAARRRRFDGGDGRVAQHRLHVLGRCRVTRFPALDGPRLDVEQLGQALLRQLRHSAIGNDSLTPHDAP